MTNEAFLFELAKDYPNIIWDNIPDLASMSWEEEPHVYQVIIYVDASPFGEDGAIAYDRGDGDEFTPIFSKDHTPDQDWRGLAQKLRYEKPFPSAGLSAAVIRYSNKL